MKLLSILTHLLLIYSVFIKSFLVIFQSITIRDQKLEQKHTISKTSIYECVVWLVFENKSKGKLHSVLSPV